MQPYFLPYIGYFQLMNLVDTFVLYDDVAFINRGWVNRNRMLLNGKEYLFTIPLKEASQNKRICDIALADDPKWRSKLQKTIEQAYRKAPFYEMVFPLTAKIINFGATNVAEFIRHSFDVINPYLGIKTKLIPSSTIYENGDLKSQERILDICRKEKATHYINPIGGMELYQKESFAESGIQLNFIRSLPLTYSQFNHEFVAWLSVLDILMFNEPAAVRPMLDKYELL